MTDLTRQTLVIGETMTCSKCGFLVMSLSSRDYTLHHYLPTLVNNYLPKGART